MITALLLAQAVFFSPGNTCEAKIISELSSANQRVLIQAYGFTSEPIANAVIDAKARGVDVRVILDGHKINGSWVTEAATVETKLVAAGIPVLIDDKHPIAHSKIIIVDLKKVLTGSYNFTNQARVNAENMVVLTGSAAVAKYVVNWNAHAAHSVSP